MEKSIWSSEGRISRKTYWVRWLICVVISFGVSLAFGALGDPVLVLIANLFSLVLTIFLIIQGVKRMHDVNKSGWYLLIPFYNFILALTPGDPGPNSYGYPERTS